MAKLWSCYSKVDGDSRERKYQDVLGVTYCYDSTVQNHVQVQAGDFLVIRDEARVYGYGRVSRVTTGPGTKTFTLCPRCRRSGSAMRTTKRPAYRCTKPCYYEFDQPLREERPVTVYEAHYAGQWQPVSQPVGFSELASAHATQDAQSAIRRLDPARGQRFLQLHLPAPSQRTPPPPPPPAPPATGDEDAVVIPGGHLTGLAKQRIGQDQFKAALLRRFGSNCAITGPQPVEILEAAHLVPFSALPEHEVANGLLLRVDLHRLMDRKLLAINPQTWRVHVSPDLAVEHADMAALEGRPLTLPPAARPRRAALNAHLASCRRQWATGKPQVFSPVSVSS